MQYCDGISIKDVQAVYSGCHGRLWELLMGKQIHIGGMDSSMDLARSASIKPGTHGVDFCCCNGAGMRFLIQFAKVAAMTGIDATGPIIEKAKQYCRIDNLEDKLNFVHADVCDTPLAGNSVDFVWGEDAWCYVADKHKLTAQAVRIVKPGGIIAFTDWIEGPAKLTDDQAQRFMSFMKFPTLADIDDYPVLFQARNCRVLARRFTGRFAPSIDLYISMLSNPLAFDALAILDFDRVLFEQVLTEMKFVQSLARNGAVEQGLFVIQKPHTGV